MRVLLCLLVVSCLACGSDPSDVYLTDPARPRTTPGPAAEGTTPGLRAATIAAVQRHADERFAFDKSIRGSFARNDIHAFSVVMANGGLRIDAGDGDDRDTRTWSVAFRWTGVGRSGKPLAPVEAPTHDATLKHGRASYHRADGSEEWYVNGPLGVEQGFVLPDPPTGSRDNELVIALSVDGDLKPTLSPDDQQVLLADASGRAALRYTDLFAQDSAGRSLPTSLAVHRETIMLVIDDRGARYPLTIDPLVWAEDKKQVASDAQAQDFFGMSVFVGGDMAIVGASGEDSGGSDAGAAYLFSRNAGGVDNWGEVKKLVASDAQKFDQFGWSVSVSGDVAVVSARLESGGGLDAGAAYLFLRNAGGVDNWGEVKKLLASDAQAFDSFGISVSVSGDMVVVGAHHSDTGGNDAGGAYLFSRDTGGVDNWGELKKLLAGDAQAQDSFGISVSVSGDTVVVGAHQNDTGGNNAGAAYLFSRDAGGTDGWGQIRKLVANDATPGDIFGSAVAVSGDVVIVGAQFESSGGLRAGAAYLFSRNVNGPNTWGEMKKIAASDAEAGDNFGRSVSISGDVAIVGAGQEDSGGPDSGAAYMYERNMGGVGHWGETIKLVASDAQANDNFGGTVSVSGAIAIVGALAEDGAAKNAGAVYVFSATPSAKAANGALCALEVECLSGFCVDGVCCDTVCGGGLAGDCQACNVTGAAGTCSSEASGTACGDQGIACLVTDSCDGAGICTDSGFEPDGTGCPGGQCNSGLCEPAGGGGTGGAGGAGPGGGTGGDTGTGAGAASGGNNAGGTPGGGTSTDPGGCGCRFNVPVTNKGWLALLAIGLLAGRRRQRVWA